MIQKERLDKILVDKGLADNPTKAKSLIMSGKVLVNGKKVDKSGSKFSLSVDVRILSKEHNMLINELKGELYSLKKLYRNNLSLEEMRNISRTDFGGLESNKKKK